MKIATIVGARPQFIKAAALSRAFQKHGIEEVLIHTGQHYDENMSKVFFQEMKIPHPHYHLGIGGGTHGTMTGRMLEAIEKVLIKEKPDCTLVYGDTNSTLAGALASIKLHIPVAHVEAGLRSFNRNMPEEINRILADQCANLLFAPSEQAAQQLLSEGIPSTRIYQVGDLMYDVSLYYRQQSQQQSSLLQQLKLSPKKYALATVHRAENTDDPQRLNEIFCGLSQIAKHLPLIIPLHPRTKQTLERLNLLKTFSEKISILDPVGYLDMIQLEANAQVILTDSGGVQKEAYFFHVPCLTLRDETEWTELIKHKYNRLVKADSACIEQAFLETLSATPHWKLGLYGDGSTAERIVSKLIESSQTSPLA